VLFLAVTAEEKGLLGAKYYAEHPLYPLDHTVANINMDGVNQWGRTSDLTVVGLGNSSLEDVLARVLAADGRKIRPDPEPEKGFYYRSDHFEFAKQGVPALYLDAGIDYVGKPSGYGMRKRDEYTNNDYHKPSDEVKPDWDLSGAVEDLRALFRVGYLVAQDAALPQWKPGTEFKARRDSMMAKR
jgi:Zn-dependent M28 family amino/carboxypeptidase